MTDLPKIYVFCNQKGCDGRGEWHSGCALAEDGEMLAQHLSSSHDFVKCDLGNRRLGCNGFNRDKEYDKKYPQGYEVVWLEGDAITPVVEKLKAARAEPVAEPSR